MLDTTGKVIKYDQSVAVIDPKMNRFMMSLNSALELILFAFKNVELNDQFT